MDTEAILLLKDFGMVIQKTIERTMSEKFTLSKHELVLLHIMSATDYEPTSQKQLSERIMADRSTMVNVVDNLERLNYIKRMKNPNNRRENLLYLTEDGEFLNNQVTKTIGKAIKSRFANVDEEKIKVFKEVLKVVLKESDES